MLSCFSTRLCLDHASFILPYDLCHVCLFCLVSFTRVQELLAQLSRIVVVTEESSWKVKDSHILLHMALTGLSSRRTLKLFRVYYC